MKRTLLEILAAMAVIVLLISFHHQISRITSDQRNVADLRQMVHQAVQLSGDQKEIERTQHEVVAKLDRRLEELETQLAEASAQNRETIRLRQELNATRLEANRFQAEIARDVSRTKELVDAYHLEFRALGRRADANLAEAQSNLRSLTDKFLPDPNTLSNELLAPTVQLNGDDTVGSGTLIYSGPNPQTQEVETYVITSYHVVRNILADSRSARRLGVAVTIYTDGGRVEERADMVSQDERIDAALLKFRSDQTFTQLARVVPRDHTDSVRVWQGVYAVGCPLGNDPIPTRGEISSVQNELKGSNYWMINAPTYFGNSGGGIYLAESRELVGVFSKIYTHGRGNPVVVPHMGLCTPMDLIYDWLDREGLTFVLQGSPERALDLSELSAPPPAPAGN